MHLAERQLSKTQRLEVQPDGRVLLRATVPDTLELRWWLLGFGDRAEVLGPKDLREEFRTIVTRLAHLYSTSGPSARARPTEDDP